MDETAKEARAGEGRYYMSSIKVGPKGQVVIPKEARDMFGISPGDTLVLLADKENGLAIQRMDQLHPYLRKVFHNAGGDK